MKSFFKWGGAACLAILIAIWGSKQEPTAPDEGYILNSKETRILYVILEDDAYSFINGYDTLLSKELISTTTVEVQKAYDANQVAADQKYFKKKLFLSGTVESINSGLGNRPYITMIGTNMFMPPILRFDEDDIEKIAALKRDQKIRVVCEGGGSLAGRAIFKNCEFPEDYAKERIAKLGVEMSDFLKGKEGTSDLSGWLVIISISTARALPDNAICFSQKEKCIEEVKEIQLNEKFWMNAKDVIDELKEKGVKVPNIPKSKK